MGPWGGYLTGTAILLEYALAPAAIVIFIGSYIHELTGFDGPVVYALFYADFVGLHLWGVGEALKIMMGITLLAVAAIVVFAVAAIPHFDHRLLFDTSIAHDPEALGAN